MVPKYKNDASNTLMIKYCKTFRYPLRLKVTFLSHKVAQSELPYSKPVFWLTDISSVREVTQAGKRQFIKFKLIQCVDSSISVEF